MANNTTHHASHHATHHTTDNEVTGWVGWIYFAGILLLLGSIFQAVMGFTALWNADFYVVSQNGLAVVNDFNTWGWAHLVVAVILLTGGFSLLAGGTWGKVVGVLAASVSLLFNLVFITAFPLWALAAIAIDLLIIYAVVVHGREVSPEEE